MAIDGQLAGVREHLMALKSDGKNDIKALGRR